MKKQPPRNLVMYIAVRRVGDDQWTSFSGPDGQAVSWPTAKAAIESVKAWEKEHPGEEFALYRATMRLEYPYRQADPACDSEEHEHRSCCGDCIRDDDDWGGLCRCYGR